MEVIVIVSLLCSMLALGIQARQFLMGRQKPVRRRSTGVSTGARENRKKEGVASQSLA